MVLGFIAFHDLFISDIWFGAIPMMIVGAFCGLSLAWSYQLSVSYRTTAAWFRYGGVYAAELILLGGVSLLVMRPQFVMAELMVANDAFERLLSPSMPIMVVTIVIGTLTIWLMYGRRPAALLPILFTQVLIVFFLGHQFAFLGLVETSTTLLLIFAEFSGLAIGLALSFSLVSTGLARVLDRPRLASDQS